MASGGYRKPDNPAPVSGPGSLSRRTDGGPTQGARYMSGGQYGESKQLMETQQAAPMAGTSKPTMQRPNIATAQNLPPIVPLSAPTQRPDEPMTAGMPFGPGPGPEALAITNTTQSLSQTLSKIIQYDTTGELTELYDYLVSRGM